MSVSANDIFLDARALINQYSEEGILIADDDVADLSAKSIRFIDMAQKELYRLGNYTKAFQYTNVPFENALGTGSEFNIVEYTGTTQYYPQEGGVAAKAYYFEVDGESDIVIQELEGGTWQDLIHYTVMSNVTSMTAYKGVITPTTAGNLVRFKFSGTYYYKHQNRCLFTSPFSASRVPDYRPWVKITLPTDFRMLDKIVVEDDENYNIESMYKFEGLKELYINYFFDGTIRVIYKPIPTTITSTSSNLEIDDITAKIISYYVAARLANFEGISEMVNYFEGKYNELKAEAFITMPQPEQKIINVYGGV